MRSVPAASASRARVRPPSTRCPPSPRQARVGSGPGWRSDGFRARRRTNPTRRSSDQHHPAHRHLPGAADHLHGDQPVIVNQARARGAGLVNLPKGSAADVMLPSTDSSVAVLSDGRVVPPATWYRATRARRRSTRPGRRTPTRWWSSRPTRECPTTGWWRSWRWRRGRDWPSWPSGSARRRGRSRRHGVAGGLHDARAAERWHL